MHPLLDKGMFFIRSDPRLYKREIQQEGYQTRSDHSDLLETTADKVHMYTFRSTYNKGLYARLNRGYLFTLWHNLRQWKLDSHRSLCWSVFSIQSQLKRQLWVSISHLFCFLQILSQEACWIQKKWYILQ
jgi:hypothetical protein